MEIKLGTRVIWYGEIGEVVAICSLDATCLIRTSSRLRIEVSDWTPISSLVLTKDQL